MGDRRQDAGPHNQPAPNLGQRGLNPGGRGPRQEGEAQPHPPQDPPQDPPSPQLLHSMSYTNYRLRHYDLYANILFCRELSLDVIQ